MRSRTLQAFLLALALALGASACSSDSTETETETGDAETSDAEASDAETTDAGADGSDSSSDGSADASDESSAETSASDETTDPSEAAADTGGGGGSDCLVGSWEAPQEVVQEQILGNLAGVPAEVELVDGSVTAEFRADQTADFLTQASVLITVPDFGELEGSMDSVNRVDWSVEGDVMTFTTTEFNLDLAVDGFPIPEVPGPAPGESGSATFTCNGDTLELEADNPLARIPTRLNRVG